MRMKKITIFLVALLVCIIALVSFTNVEFYFSNTWSANFAAPEIDDSYLYQVHQNPPDVDEQNPVEVQELSELEMKIIQQKLLVQMETSAENYLHLANLYEEAGMIRNLRDALERSYRLGANEEVFIRLQDVVVNVYEESNLIQEMTQSIKRYLGDESYHANAVRLITDEEWFGVMMPNLSEGKRNYYLEDMSDGSILFVEVGYDAQHDNIPYTRVWHYTPANDDIVNLFQTGNMFQLVQTNLINGNFEGEFSVWLCVINGDTIHHDTGTFWGGVIVGELVSRVYSAPESSDLVSLFNLRNYVEYEIYLGNFNDYGETTISPPRGATDSQVAYALSEDGRKFLFYAMPEYEVREDFVFDYSFFGLSVFPDFEAYTPLPAGALQGSVTLNLANVQIIRIYDSVIQWFDGEIWHDMGDVRDFITQDPHRNDLIVLGNVRGFDNIVQTSANGGITSLLINRGGVSAVQAQPAPQAPQAPQTSQAPPASGGGGGGTPPPPPPPPPPLPPLPPTDGDDDGWSDIHL